MSCGSSTSLHKYTSVRFPANQFVVVSKEDKTLKCVQLSTNHNFTGELKYVFEPSFVVTKELRVAYLYLLCWIWSLQQPSMIINLYNQICIIRSLICPGQYCLLSLVAPLYQLHFISRTIQFNWRYSKGWTEAFLWCQSCCLINTRTRFSLCWTIWIVSCCRFKCYFPSFLKLAFVIYAIFLCLVAASKYFL